MTADLDLENSMKFLLSKLSADELHSVKKLVEELIDETDVDVKVPVEIFSKGLNVVESITKYLKEDKKLSFSDIAQIFGRKENTVWLNYDRASKKMPQRFVITGIPGLQVPLTKLMSDEFSILECLVIYLRDVESLPNKEVAFVLGTSQVVTSVAYNRAKRK